MGGAEYFVDGNKVDWSERLVFKGIMLDDVPNLCFAIGYTTSSWTLKIGLLCGYFCRLLNEMDNRGVTVCVPQRPRREMEQRPLLDFGACYVRRSINILPRQGDSYPWEMTFNYLEDERMLKQGEVVDPALKLSSAAAVMEQAAE